jgi:hypothetical protein
MAVAKSNIQRSLSLTSASGTVLSLLGLFLPWGTLTWPPNVMGGFPNQVLGFEVVIGDFALAGCLLSILFLVRNISRPKQSVKFVFAGETVVAFFSLLWILGSRYLTFGWTFGSFKPAYYAPMYGTYVSFIGSLVTLSAIGIEMVASKRESAYLSLLSAR